MLSGLDIDGVPRNLTNTVFPFEYNNIKQLEEIINTKDIGTVKMEVVRNIQPEEGFLEKVRELTKKKDIVLILMNAPVVLERHSEVYQKIQY